jgi:hypothetical protein
MSAQCPFFIVGNEAEPKALLFNLSFTVIKVDLCGFLVSSKLVLPLTLQALDLATSPS